MSELEYKSGDESEAPEQPVQVAPEPVVQLPTAQPKPRVRRVKKVDVFAGQDPNSVIPPVGRPKRPRTEAQKAATAKMLAKLKEKREVLDKVKQETLEIKKQQEAYVKDYIKQKLTQKELKKMALELAQEDDYSIADSSVAYDDLPDLSDLSDDESLPVQQPRRVPVRKQPVRRTRVVEQKSVQQQQPTGFKINFAD